LYCRGVIPPEHSCWDSVDVFAWKNGNISKKSDKEKRNFNVPPTSKAGADYLPRLSHNIKLKSAAGYPTYTNYTKDFKELLDYIYVEKERYDVVKIAPFPSEEVLSENCAIPSEVFPSDHVSLVVDVQLKGA
jgi:hypothetical protein